MLELLLQQHGAVLLPLILSTLYLVIQLVRRTLALQNLPSKLPIIGAKPGEWFSLPRARWRVARDMKNAVRSAYANHRNETVILPVAGADDMVVLPAREEQWLTDQPDEDISMHQQVLDTLQLDYTTTDPRLSRDPVHHHVIATTLTRETGNLVPALFDELQHVVDDLFGTDIEGWKDMTVYPTLQRVIGHVTNRVFVGLPLCRNKTLLDLGIAYAMEVPLTSTILRFVWEPLRPLFALIITLPNRIHANRFYRLIRPEVQRRLAIYEAQQAGPENKALEPEPNDFLQWSVHQAKESGDPYLCELDTLAARILLLNFASIHTSSFAITHALLDLAAADPRYLGELRDEITSVLAQHGGAWNKRAIAAMPKLDSVMRESQRLNSFIIIASMRKVVNPNGVTTPSGVHLKPGTMIGAPGYPVMHDGDIYENPDKFVPFRFSDKRRALSTKKTSKGEEAVDGHTKAAAYIERARQAWATTSPEYTAFGHGRYACPGRFFAAAELKLMLAYIVLNYDIQKQARPRNTWFGMNRVPPMKATIKVRRREGPVISGD